MRFLFLLALMLWPSTLFAIGGAKPFHIHAMALESAFFTPPTKVDIMKWGKEVDLGTPQLDFLFRLALSPAPKPRPYNDMKGARILLIDTRNRMEIYITSSKAAVFNGRELPIKPAAIDQIIDQIKRAPWVKTK